MVSPIEIVIGRSSGILMELKRRVNETLVRLRRSCGHELKLNECAWLKCLHPGDL
jgi:hypothetical protein